jgi:hypothetical protein
MPNENRGGSKLVTMDPFCRQVSFSGPELTPSLEEHKRFKHFVHFEAIRTGGVGLIKFLPVEKFLRIFCYTGMQR